MKAFGHRRATRMDEAVALVELDIPPPVPGPQDVVVEIRAVSVNPADTKLRSMDPPGDAADSGIRRCGHGRCDRRSGSEFPGWGSRFLCGRAQLTRERCAVSGC